MNKNQQNVALSGVTKGNTNESNDESLELSVMVSQFDSQNDTNYVNPISFPTLS